MKWKPDKWVCVIRVKRFVLTALWSDPCSLHKTLFHEIHLHMSLTLQVLLDRICLALLPNEQESKGSLLSGGWDHPPRLATFLLLQVLNLSSLYEPSPSSGEGGLVPCTPHLTPMYSFIHPPLPHLPGSVLGKCVPGSTAHWGGPYLPPCFLKATGAQNWINCHPVFWAHSLAPSPRRSLIFCIFVFYWGEIHLTKISSSSV